MCDRRVFGLKTFAEIEASPDSNIEWLVEGIVQANAPVLIHADTKCCKTLLALDLAIACASGGDWLGCRAAKAPTAMISIENGLPSLRQNIEFICNSRKIDVPGGLFIGPEFEDIEDEHVLLQLSSFISSNFVKLCVFDPAYLLLGDYQHTHMADAGRKLFTLSEVCRKAGATCVAIHHDKKSGRDLQAAAGAGFAQWPSSWVSIRRKGPYSKNGIHELELTYGGRAGQQGKLPVRVDEGCKDGRTTKCDIKVIGGKVGDATSSAARREPEGLKILEFLRSEGPASMSEIAKRVGGAKETVKGILSTLEESGTLKKTGCKFNVAQVPKKVTV